MKKSPLFLLPIAIWILCPLMGVAQNYNSKGDSVFASSIIHDVHLDFAQTGYWDSLTSNYTADRYMVCALTFDSVSMDSVGVKFKGNSSYNNSSQKKSFKVGIDEYINGQDVDGLEKFNLNNGFKDPSFLREKLMLDFMWDHNIPAPRCTFARVYINGTYWGLYDLVEEVNKDMLKDRFDDKRGNLFKGDPHGDLRWLGSTASSYYSNYELKTNETTNDWSDLVDLINVINNTPTAQLDDSLPTRLNMTNFIYQWAMYNMFVNLDSYIGSGHNYYIYHDSINDRFEWLAWDVNEAFGNFNLMMSVSQLESLSITYLSQPNNKPLCQKLLSDQLYFQEYINAICYFTNAGFSNVDLDPKIDSLANRIRTDVYADPHKFFTNAEFETNLTSDVNSTPGLKSFITARRNSLVSQMASYGCYLGEAPVTTTPENLSVAPNPFSSSFTVSLPQDWKAEEVSLELIDMTGRDVSATATISRSGNTITINDPQLSRGMYVLRLSNNGVAAAPVKIVRQ